MTYDCNPCCKKGPSCGAIGGTWCSGSGSCPAGYNSLGRTYDCNPCCRAAAPQGQMQFSSSTSKTVSAGYSSLTAFATVVDSSQGCSHSNYSTKVVIRSPSGRSVSSQSSGLSSGATISIAGEVGNYSIVTTLFYRCSCINWGNASWAKQETYTLPRPANLHKVGNDAIRKICDGTPACGGTYEYSRTRTWGVYDQAGSPWRFVAPVLGSQTNTAVNQCNLAPAPWAEFMTNNQGQFPREYYAFIPACHTRPYCQSVLTETFSVLGYPFSHSLAFGCWDVTISRQ